jgi:tRNA (guanine-N7-)-methyltransferase
LRVRQADLLSTLLPTLAVPADGALDPAALFDAPRAVWLEIGFGAGEHLAAQARMHSDVGIIGCEAYVNGVAKLLARVERESIANVRVLLGDARALLPRLSAASIGRVFLLFPDPWPKRRHWKRRFLQPETLDDLARTLAKGGELRVATDWGEYARWSLALLTAHPHFEWAAEAPADWRQRPGDWPETRYEQKARAAGRTPVYLTFQRK